MLRNYILVALRSVRRHKSYFTLNVAGLAIGLAACILVILWVQHQVSYDRFHDDLDRLQRVAFTTEAEHFHGEYLPGPLAPYLEREYPEIEYASMLAARPGWKLAVEDRGFLFSGSPVDTSFFHIFTLPFAAGDPAQPFPDPYTIVLTESAARRLFGDTDPIGQPVQIADAAPLRVTGVLQDLPENSSIQFDFLIPRLIAPGYMQRWDNKAVEVYVKLAAGTSPVSYTHLRAHET